MGKYLHLIGKWKWIRPVIYTSNWWMDILYHQAN